MNSRAISAWTTLGYLSLEGMLGAVPTGPDGYCHACFSGRYPTALPNEPELLRAGALR
jgi:amidophosphoribosyltransferase